MAHFETAMDLGQKFWYFCDTRSMINGKWVSTIEIEEAEVEEIRILDVDYIRYLYDMANENAYESFREKDIGKKVFLTRADAEAYREKLLSE